MAVNLLNECFYKSQTTVTLNIQSMNVFGMEMTIFTISTVVEQEELKMSKYKTRANLPLRSTMVE